MTRMNQMVRRLSGLLVVVACSWLGLAQAADTVTYYHTDGLGTPVMESNTAGQVTYAREQRPYGEQALGTAKNGPGFTGHVGDADSGLTYMQQRYYDPMSGRSLSTDPVAVDSNTGGNFNRYWYANNNPYKFTDPDGRQAMRAALRPEELANGQDFTMAQQYAGGSGFAAPPAPPPPPAPPQLNMTPVTLPGLGDSYLDSGMASRVDAWTQNASTQGVNLTFNSAFRDQGAQNALQNDPNAITPASLSLHSAGFAVDVNYSSLRNIPGGLTGDQQRAIILQTAEQAGLSWGGTFRTPDPPHFYFDPGGDRRQLIVEAARQVRELQSGGQ